MDEDILRRQAAMIQALAVRVAKRLGKLSQQPQTRFSRQVGEFFSEEAV